MTNQLLSLKPLTYEGNPLLDFSLANMLDRFSFKKAKKRSNKSNGFQKLINKNKLRRSKIEEPLSIKNLKENDGFRADEQFFAKFFKGKQERK